MNTNTNISRQLDNLGSIGTVIAVDAVKGQIRLQVDDNETDWIDFPAVAAGAVKVWRCPSIGEQFAVLAQGGELCNAIPIVALFSDNNPRPSIDPDEILIQLPDGNFISIHTGSKAAVFKLKMVTWDVETTIFTGTVHANDAISSDKDVTAGSISLKNHTTTGVRSGSEVSGVPQ